MKVSIKMKRQQQSVISWFRCYYVTLLQTNTSAYPFLFSLKEQNVLEMPPFLKHPTLLCAEASDSAIGKGRGLLWAVSNHECISTSYSPEETSTHWDVPLRASQLLTHGWHSSSCKLSHYLSASRQMSSCWRFSVQMTAFELIEHSQVCAISAKTKMLLYCWYITDLMLKYTMHLHLQKKAWHSFSYILDWVVFCQKQCWWDKRGNYKV